MIGESEDKIDVSADEAARAGSGTEEKIKKNTVGKCRHAKT